jgi:hypothetical protein
MTETTTPPPPRTAFALLADAAPDAVAIAGAGLITYGVSLIHRPAAFIVAGGFLLLGAWLFARKTG